MNTEKLIAEIEALPELTMPVFPTNDTYIKFVVKGDIINIIRKHSELVQIDHAGRPMTYWGGLAKEQPPSSKLNVCPECGGEADNGHDRELPPNPYVCSKCEGEQPTPADDTMRETFSKTIQELINFVSKAADYQGELTNDTACQLLRDIELDALRLSQPAKPAMTREELENKQMKDLLFEIEVLYGADMPFELANKIYSFAKELYTAKYEKEQTND